jgi:hypothetical protein
MQKGQLIHCWQEFKLAQTLWKIVQKFLKTLEIELPHDPVIPVLAIAKENESVCQR